MKTSARFPLKLAQRHRASARRAQCESFCRIVRPPASVMTLNAARRGPPRRLDADRLIMSSASESSQRGFRRYVRVSSEDHRVLSLVGLYAASIGAKRDEGRQ